VIHVETLFGLHGLNPELKNCDKNYKSVVFETSVMSSAAKVELYVSKRPYIKEALAEGIINYSALGRKICREENIESLQAVKAALSRYQEHVSKERRDRKNKVEKVLRDTSIEVQPGVKVVKKRNKDEIISAETKNGFTSIIENGDKALITLESPETLENTPGVIEFILSSLAAEGINVDQLISCREDTHIVIEDSKASEALSILQDRL